MNKGIKMLMLAGAALLALGSCQKEDYKIQSNPDEFAVYPLAIPVAAEGGEYTLNITGNEDWELTLTAFNTKTEDWCTLSQTSGKGAAEIKLNITESNSLTKLREFVIEVKSASKTLQSKVLQKTRSLGEKEVLINGLVWSTVNVNMPGEFCESPDDQGMYYQFNSKIPWAPCPDGTAVEGYTEDPNCKANVQIWEDKNNPCPEGWRVPTVDEFLAVYNKGNYRAEKAQTGFKRWGAIVGLDPAVAATANAENLKELGGLFIPNTGWINENGVHDRGWLACIRLGSALNETHAGLFLTDVTWYTDKTGGGDGQKGRASSVRCVMITED